MTVNKSQTTWNIIENHQNYTVGNHPDFRIDEEDFIDFCVDR